MIIDIFINKLISLLYYIDHSAESARIPNSSAILPLLSMWLPN